VCLVSTGNCVRVCSVFSGHRTGCVSVCVCSVFSGHRTECVRVCGVFSGHRTGCAVCLMGTGQSQMGDVLMAVCCLAQVSEFGSVRQAVLRPAGQPPIYNATAHTDRARVIIGGTTTCRPRHCTCIS
jgi:hypothetical protein